MTDLSGVAKSAHEKGALLVSVFTEAVSLGLVTPPGEMGADMRLQNLLHRMRLDAELSRHQGCDGGVR